MSQADLTYARLLSTVLSAGKHSASRAGNTTRLFGAAITFNLAAEFPLFTLRKLHPKGMFGELAAFIQGATTLKTFKDFGCNYWDANAAAWPVNAGRMREDWSVGQIYGANWRNWRGQHDQLKALVTGLRANPSSRRHVLSTYDPIAEACLPPCHLLAQFSVEDGVLDCLVFMRSVDLVLGLPSDVVVYATLQLLLAKEVDLTVGSLTFMLGDTHIYEQHIPAAKSLISAASFPAPTVTLLPEASLFSFHPSHIEVSNYEHGPAIQLELNV